MYRRMVFNVLIDNQDDHAKNFAFLFDNAKKIYRLSPAYAITPGRTFFGEHMTAVNGKGKDIGDDDMIKVAANNKIDVSTAESILENCRRVIGRRA